MDDGALPPVDERAVHPATRSLVLNGALPDDETLTPIEDELVALLRDKGTRVRSYTLRDLPLAHCQGCFECWTRTPGLCKTDGDAGHEIAAALIRSDLTAVLTPITFGGYSSEIKKALDRVICLVSPFFRRIDGEVHHRRRYGRYPGLVGVGVLWEPDQEQERIFRTLLARNARNLGAPVHAACILPANAPRAVLFGRLEACLQPVLEAAARRAA